MNPRNALWLVVFVAFVSPGVAGADKAHRTLLAYTSSLQRLAAEPTPAGTPEQAATWRHDRSRRLEAMLDGILREFPRDIERWRAVLVFADARQLDPAALERARAMIQELLETDDVLEETRERARHWQTGDRLKQVLANEQRSVEQRMQDARQLIDAHAHVALGGGRAREFELRFLEWILKSAPAGLDAYLMTVAAKQDSVLSAAVEAILIRDAWRKRPRDIRFVTTDGQPFVLQQLRGKVVLLDFWTTSRQPGRRVDWRQLQKDHPDDFVVVGICCDSAGLSPGDLLDVQAEKMQKARARFKAHMEQHPVPWPVYFDGLGFGGQVPRQCGLDRIPACYLISRDGLLLAAEAGVEDAVAALDSPRAASK
jgi:hypothetical protein